MLAACFGSADRLLMALAEQGGFWIQNNQVLNMERKTRREFVGSAVLAMGATMTAQAATDTGRTNPHGTSTSESKPGYLITYAAGPAFLAGKPLSEQPLQEHGRYMLDLHKRGVLRMAGGFGDDSGGAAFVDASSLEAAREIAEADPAVQSKVFVYRVQQWNLVPWRQIAERTSAK